MSPFLAISGSRFRAGATIIANFTVTVIRSLLRAYVYMRDRTVFRDRRFHRRASDAFRKRKVAIKI